MATAANETLMTIIDQLPLLAVAVPLLSAPLCIIFGNRTAAWLMAFAASVISFVFTAHILLQVLDGDVLSYSSRRMGTAVGH